MYLRFAIFFKRLIQCGSQFLILRWFTIAKVSDADNKRRNFGTRMIN
jgi:hypothetical protein